MSSKDGVSIKWKGDPGRIGSRVALVVAAKMRAVSAAADSGPFRGDHNRPQSGLSSEEALSRWSEPEEYAAVLAMGTQSTDLVQQKEYAARRLELEEALADKLLEGTLLSSAIQQYDDRRRVLDPSLYSILWIDYEFMEIVGAGRRYLAPEIFEPSAIPLNVREVPSWLARSQSAPGTFAFDSDYRHVSANGRKWTLGVVQRRVIKALHEASLNGSPWVSGKVLLHEAKSQSLRISDLFKSKSDWQELIESNQRGEYRLKVAER